MLKYMMLRMIPTMTTNRTAVAFCAQREALPSRSHVIQLAKICFGEIFDLMAVGSAF